MYLSAKEAAERKNVTVQAIYAAWERGLLAHEIIAGKRVTTEAALAEYIPLRRDERKGVKYRWRKAEEETTDQDRAEGGANSASAE